MVIYPLQSPNGHIAFKPPIEQVWGFNPETDTEEVVPASELLILENWLVSPGRDMISRKTVEFQQKLLCYSGSISYNEFSMHEAHGQSSTWLTQGVALHYSGKPPWKVYYLARKG